MICLASRREVAALTELTTKLLASITFNEIPAIGFVNENKLLDNGKLNEWRVALLQMWVDAGLELGNHTFSHPDLNRTPRRFNKTSSAAKKSPSVCCKPKAKRCVTFAIPFFIPAKILRPNID
jgi:hypothetical protein